MQSETEKWPPYVDPENHTRLSLNSDALVGDDNSNYPVVDDIPRFVPSSGYTETFGVQWNHYRLTQLDSHTGLPLTKDRMRRCIGEELWPVLANSNVLECGCGAGRFTEVLFGQGANVTSIDLGSAVEANQINFPQNSSHRIAQADIMRLPFSPLQFDFVICLGVVQHTPNPEATIEALYNHVKPGGWLIIYHYTPTLSRYTKSATLLRILFRRLPPTLTISWTRHIVKILLPIHRWARNHKIFRMAFSRISPVYSYYHAYPELSDDLQREWAFLDTHDGLTDWYKHLRTKGQIYSTLKKLGTSDIWCERGGNGVEARCRRPE